MQQDDCALDRSPDCPITPNKGIAIALPPTDPCRQKAQNIQATFCPPGGITVHESVQELGNTIDLLPRFYGETPTAQAFTLIHEGLHVYTGANDPSLQNALHIPVIPGYSQNITTFLQGGCR